MFYWNEKPCRVQYIEVHYLIQGGFDCSNIPNVKTCVHGVPCMAESECTTIPGTWWLTIFIAAVATSIDRHRNCVKIAQLDFSLGTHGFRKFGSFKCDETEVPCIGAYFCLFLSYMTITNVNMLNSYSWLSPCDPQYFEQILSVVDHALYYVRYSNQS